MSILKLGSLDWSITMSSSRPYIGCRIALISKAQNRYEGLLYTIDRVNSTVVLAKGECFNSVTGSRVNIISIVLEKCNTLISICILLQSNVLELRADPLTDQHHLKMMSMIISPSVEVILRISHSLNL